MSTTTRSRRGRCIALATVTAGVSWLTTGPAIAGPSPASDSTGATVICQPPTGAPRAGNILNRNTRRAPAGYTALAPATAVLSFADAAGAAAGRGMHSLPGRSTVANARSAVAPATAGLAPVGSGAVLPSAKAPAAPVLDVMPIRPSVSDAVCLPTLPAMAARTQSQPQDRVRPISNPKPEQSRQSDGSRAQEGTPPGGGASGASRATGTTTTAETAREPNEQAAGQHRANRRTIVDQPRKNRGERKAADRSQPALPRQQQEDGNKTATGGQRGAAQTGARRNDRHERQQPDQAGPASSAAAATDAAAPSRRVKREGREKRVYPKAPTVQQDAAASEIGDITTPDLAQSTGTHPLVDLAGAAGRSLLP